MLEEAQHNVCSLLGPTPRPLWATLGQSYRLWSLVVAKFTHFYLFQSDTEREEDLPLIHSSNTSNSWAWDWLKASACNSTTWSPTKEAGTHVLESSAAASRGISRELHLKGTVPGWEVVL